MDQARADWEKELFNVFQLIKRLSQQLLLKIPHQEMLEIW